MFKSHLNSGDLLLYQLLDEVDDGILVIADQKVIFSNNKLIHLLSIEGKIELPCSIESFFSNKNLNELKKLIQENYNNKSTNETPLIINNKKLNFKSKIFKYNHGKIYTIIVKELQHEEFTKENRSFEDYSGLFPFILLEIDTLGQILKYNLQFEKKLFYSETDLKENTNLKDIVSKGNKPVIDSLLTNYAEFEKSGQIELKFRKKTGATFPALMYFSPILKKDKFKGLRCLILDISENKHIENKYRQNQQRLRKVLDLVPHMIFLKDGDGNILLANKTCADFYNTTAKNMVYSNISDFHKYEEECKRILNEDREVISRYTKLNSIPNVLTDLKNKKHIFETTKIPFTDPASGQVHSLGIMVDITDKIKFEEEIKDTKEKYRLLVERGSDGILIIQDETIVFANKQAARMFGRPLEDFISYPLDKIIRRDYLKKAIAEYAKDVRNKEIDNYYEIKIHKPEGEIAYGEAKLNIINYEGKKSRLVFIRDITKRKIAEKRAERDKNMLEQAQKIAQLGSWEWDIQKSTLFCSDEILRILEVDNVIINTGPRWLASFIPELDKSNAAKSFIGLLRKGGYLELEFPVVSHRGKRKIIHSQSQVFKDKSGKPERVIGTWRDISERIRFEQILKEAKSKAEESDKLKSAFLANMSHEIRTPMNAILGFATLLKRTDIEHHTRLDYIGHILQSGEGLLKLINDIVDISKIESNQMKIENGPVLLNHILDQLYNRYEELLILKNHESLKLSVEKAFPDTCFTIITDVFRLQQVISNLLNNSIKFTSEGEIKFGYSIANGELQFFVQDEGIGIPPEKREIIFKRFGKLDDPGRINISGTGLGLSISKSLVELMKGRIWLESGEPGNTKFCFTIPMVFAQPEKNEDLENNDISCIDNLDLREKTILIAEDELLNYKLLEVLLKKTGATILWAKTGIEAVQMAAAEKVDLVFMDIKMPEMNGYEATKAIKKIDKNIPVIAQTAFAFSNERKYILQSGCDMYLTKPIDHKEMYQALKHFLE